MRKKVFVALLIGALFLCPKFGLRKMQVTYICNGYVSLVDSEGEAYGIFADGLEIGQEILAFYKGNGNDLQILDYTEVKNETGR